ncbi:MAG: response regulator [Hydrocarboniphaga sp.]|uniref:putative bifunctional diguanylate cyclase/phosphodiesterase n=1 Tax=Hydrocarboniphaga sp. TaxID=2033016 RepID=UPI002623F9A1|nr:diguanylate cyclase [Hydrocarboniphaga sp.]MDB5969009.1 response regulator [Hydrocarboniphaga sp.]
MNAVASRRQPIGILLVEDSAADARLLSESLRDVAATEPVVIRVVRTLTEALAEMKRYSFTCVLLDLNLPDGHGVANVEALRSIDRRVAIVVLTGNDDEHVAVEAIRLGAQEYLIKGHFDGTKILRLLRHAIERNKHVYDLEDQRYREFHRASHDSLTGLANRELLYDRLEQSIGQAHLSGETFALCYLDLDGFKAVNDRYGHRVGDDLLVRVAQILRETVRPADSVARVGGDEFLVLMRQFDNKLDAGPRARRMRERVMAVRQIGEHQIDLDASVGIVLFPQHGETVEVLMERADRAMYEAKRAGGGVAFYEDALAMRAADRAADFRAELELALEQDRFSLLYHPWIDVTSQNFVGTEVLLRWDREGGMQGPDDFLRAAAASGRGCEIGLHVAMKALMQWRSWVDQGLRLGSLSLNVGEAELGDERYLPALAKIAVSAGIDPADLHLEVPVSLLAGELSHDIASQLRQARELGFGVLLDQFGPDGEAMKWITTLPLSGVKLGRHVMRALQEEGQQGSMHRSVLAMRGAADALCLPVVVTGVETVEESRILQAMGCKLMQGQLFSSAETADRLPERLRLGPEGLDTARWPAQSHG